MIEFMTKEYRWWAGGAAFGALLLAGLIVVGNGKVNGWINSGNFGQMLDRETSKGLKLQAHYSPVSRVGWLGLRGDGFKGTNGQKTVQSLDAQGISGWFNPFGILFSCWQINDVHIKSGTIRLQKSKLPPAKPRGMPWWGWFWPYRAQLEDVKVDDATATTEVNGKEAGIYHGVLEMTPNGHDFEYDAHGGTFKTPYTPPLGLQHLHMLIRKPKLTCQELRLGDDPAHPEEQLRATGDVGLQKDRSINVAIDVAALQISPWLPENLRAHVLGHASGHIDYSSQNADVKLGEASGHLEALDAVLHEVPQISRYLAVTGSPGPGDLHLSTCRADLAYDAGAVSAHNIEVECRNVFRLEGNLMLGKDKALSGSLQLGLNEAYLSWLPDAYSVFSKPKGTYHFATVQLSGSAEHPETDLIPRVTALIRKSPKTELKLFFNQVQDWL